MFTNQLKYGLAISKSRNDLILEMNRRLLSTGSILCASETKKPKTGILMLNMGGPKTTADVQDFLSRLLSDPDIVSLPAKKILGPMIAKARAPSIAKKYEEIGGGSPIHYWTQRQGELMCKVLDEKSPETGPHKAYSGFRYVSPLTEEALDQMEKDGVERVVAFSQFPQYSCATSGSSFNAVHDHLSKKDKLNYDISFISHWPVNPLYVKSIAENVRKELDTFSPEKRKEVIILFSAHSLPQFVMNRGDPYPAEIGATVQLVMEQLNWCNPYRVVWQSKVGFMPWLSPSTENAIKALVKRGHKNLMLVPIAFVNEHIETLHEMDIEYAHDLGKEVGAERIARCPTPNDSPLFIEALADVVQKHLANGPKASPQLMFRCPMCTNPNCAPTKDWIRKVTQSV